MIKTLPTDQQLDMGPVTIWALRSLTKSHMDHVTKAVGALPAAWFLDIHDDYDGYLSAIIEPADQSSATFLLSGTIERIEISMMDRDDRILTCCGSFTTIEAAIAELQTLLKLKGR